MYLKIKKLLSEMTLDEKIAQLGSIPVDELVDEKNKFSCEKAEKLIKNGIGQITRVAGGLNILPEQAARIANDIQKFLVENTRSAIPAIIHEECLSGFMAFGATTFPQAIGMASTWEPELIRGMAEVISAQLRASGAHQGLAPVLDVLRDPRWGRCEETFGEDPYLVAAMGTAYIEGLQGDSLKSGILATAKHFAGHGYSEGGRNCAPAHVGRRELRDVFLFPFEAAVREAGVKSVMNAYNEIDGVPCTASRELLTDILREEWGFDGIVIADYGSIDHLHRLHKIALDKKEAAKMALEAGIDIELPKTDCYGQPLLEAVIEGVVSESTIDQAAGRVLYMKLALGLFENAFVDPGKVYYIFETEENRKLAGEIARKSIVLLKNDNKFLPLNKNIGTIAIIGPNAASHRNLTGDYGFAAHICNDDNMDQISGIRIISIMEGIKSKVSPGTKVIYAKGCSIMDNSTEGFAEAVEVAEKADAAVIVVGDKPGFMKDATSGEGIDREDISIYGIQGDLIRAVYETGTPVVVVLVNGRPLTIKEIAGKIPAIIEAWFPGEEGGNAVADALFGDYNPAGRLPVSYANTLGQIPNSYNLKPFSYINYLDMQERNKSLYSFGHGLSYTEFKYGNPSIFPSSVGVSGKVRISLEIENTGDIDGEEVVQLYVRDRVASVTRPVKELKGFKRLSLKAGEKKGVTFTLFVDQLAFRDKDERLVVEPGVFEVMIGSSSEDIRLRGSFEVTGEKREVAGSHIFFSLVE